MAEILYNGGSSRRNERAGGLRSSTPSSLQSGFCPSRQDLLDHMRPGSSSQATLDTLRNPKKKLTGSSMAGSFQNLRKGIQSLEAEIIKNGDTVRESRAPYEDRPLSSRSLGLRTKGMQLSHDAHSLRDDLQELSDRSHSRAALLSSIASSQHEVQRLMQTINSFSKPDMGGTQERMSRPSTSHSITQEPFTRSSHRGSPLWTAAAAAAAAAIEGRRSERMFNRLSRWQDVSTNSASDSIPTAAQQKEIAESLLRSTTVCISNKTSEPCCICLENMAIGENLSMLSCMHRLHGACLTQWLLGKTATVCPLCKCTSKTRSAADELMWNRLFATLIPRERQTKQAVIAAIQRTSRSLRGPRRGWQVKAAAWVKRAHVDRGDKKVGLLSTTGTFHIIEDLRPRYIVPDFTGCDLKPYVGHYNKSTSTSNSAAVSEATTTRD